MGQRVFSKLQWGLESSNGTAVAADTILSFAAQEVPPDRTVHFPTENLGVRVANVRAATYNYLARYSLESAEGCYFQALPMLFSILLKGNVTPVEQNGGEGDYKWDFTPDLTFGADNSLDSITLEMGDDTQAYEIEYGMLETLNISGNIAQDDGISTVDVSGNLFGRQVSTASYTGALSIPTMTQMNAKLARLYVDSAWAGVGGTEKTNILRGWSIDIVGGAHPKFMGSANKYFNTHGQGDIALMATLTLERNSDSDSLFDDFQAETFRVFRLEINGPQIGSGDLQNLTIDFGGHIEEIVPLANQDKGNNIDTALVHMIYDTTGSKGLQVTTTTDVSAI